MDSMSVLRSRVTARVLVVDDEPFMLKLLQLSLRQLGFTRTTTCDSGYRALHELDNPQGPPDLILLDLNMPKMDGVEFLRRLVERRYAGAVILVSGEDEQLLQSVERLVLEHRINSLGHLQKPFKPEALAARIETWAPAGGVGRQVKGTPYCVDDVRAAIANRQLVNYYQPVVAANSGELVSIESLVRWRHPEGRIVYPDQFIGVAEANGLIGDLTKIVLAAALAQATAWRDAGLALRMAVNVSVESLSRLGFPDLVTNYAAAAGVSPDSVVLEVTESRLIASPANTLDVLNRLRLKRFRLSIDDFGTGHSSLAQLRDIPFDQLKVDRSFVHGAATDAKLRAIIGASLTLGQQLNMEVVAEGVEDRADWDFIRHVGFNLAQGFFIAKPMPAEDLVGWLDDWKARLSRESLLSPPETLDQP